MFATTNHRISVFTTNGSQPVVHQEQTSILTSIFMNSVYLITGDKYGLLEYRNVKNGKVLYNLNVVSYAGFNDRDAALGRRINKISLFFKEPDVFVFAAHEGLISF